MSKCDRAENLRDYAFDELAADERRQMDLHLATCGECAADLDQLRLTTAALRILPDREIPQRIAFVSDKVFEPSAVVRFFGGFWNSAARLGFLSACVLGAALLVSAYHRPAEVRTVVQTGGISKQDLAQQVDVAVSKAVAQVRSEDARFTRAALEAADRKHEQEHRALVVAMQENLEVMQKHLGTYTTLASAEVLQTGTGQ